jgi:tetratricopeptide (TPR) repeat protein
MTNHKYYLFLILLLSSLSAVGQFKLYEKGHDSYTAGKYPEAIKYFSEYLTKPVRDKAMDVEVRYLRALSYYKSGDFRNAIPDFEEAILLGHANKGNIYWFKAKCQDKLIANEEAISDYSNALRELDADHEAKSKLLYERSQVHSRMGNVALAYEDLKNGATLNPSHAEIRKELEKLDKQNLASRSSTPDNKSQPGTKKQKPETGKGNTDVKKEERLAGNNAPAGGTGNLNAVQKKTEDTGTQSQPSVVTVPPVVTQPTLADFYKDEKRYALVIGNSNYPKQIGMLKNPVNDATDIAKELENSNFDVQLLTNATYGQIRAALLKFKEKVDRGDREKTVALFYFAGHGVQFEDENYLVPIDASVEFEDDIARYCFPVQRMVLSNMERSNARMNIVILDACRNNPFPSLTRSAGQHGLGEMRRARGSFIAYATAPGSVASDGTGRNGLYTQELLKAMKKPGLTIEQVFKEVRANVLRHSGDRQNTWDSSNIIGEFYFKF